MIFLYADVLSQSGGIETYLHALALHLRHEEIPFRVAVSEQQRSPIVDELVANGIQVYRQRIIPGDRWHLRKRLLNLWLSWNLRQGDLVYCVRQPMPELYLGLVRAVHRRGAEIAASWIFAPEFLKPAAPWDRPFRQAVAETDIVISVARCTAPQFKDVYGYDGPVHVVNYHNLEFCAAALPMPDHPPFRIGYMGRIDIVQKNLDTILAAFKLLAARRSDVELHFYGDGADAAIFRAMVQDANLGDKIVLHGPYDHRRDLKNIISSCHLFIYTSRFEGGPCFSLLELLQAGRYVVTSPVGGIPDLYAEHPECGVMVEPDDPKSIAHALNDALELIQAGKLDQVGMREYYERSFGMAAAHRAWLRALGPESTQSALRGHRVARLN